MKLYGKNRTRISLFTYRASITCICFSYLAGQELRKIPFINMSSFSSGDRYIPTLHKYQVFAARNTFKTSTNSCE